MNQYGWQQKIYPDPFHTSVANCFSILQLPSHEAVFVLQS